jgi:hypothetical protein
VIDIRGSSLSHTSVFTLSLRLGVGFPRLQRLEFRQLQRGRPPFRRSDSAVGVFHPGGLDASLVAAVEQPLLHQSLPGGEELPAESGQVFRAVTLSTPPPQEEEKDAQVQLGLEDRPRLQGGLSPALRHHQFVLLVFVPVEDQKDTESERLLKIAVMAAFHWC